jgi:hypothetical protein
MAAVDEIFEVTIPSGVFPGDQMTVGLPDGQIHTLVVPRGVHPGAKVQIAVPPKPPSTLGKLTESAKRAASAVQQKARDEQWDAKAKAATKAVVSTGAGFISGFKQGLQGTPRASEPRLPLPPPLPPPYAVPAERFVVAIVPEGFSPGMQMIVSTPEGYRQVTVPQGFGAGSELHVRY